jgi:hypothetical protein
VSQLPSDALQYRVPVQVLDRRQVARGNSQVAQVLVRWSELPDDLATWEDYKALKQVFPHAPKQAIKTRGMSAPRRGLGAKQSGVYWPNGQCDAAQGPPRGMLVLPAQNGLTSSESS